MDLLIRNAGPPDLPALLALYRHLNPGDEQPNLSEAEAILTRLSQFPGSEIYVGVVENQLVCSCTLVVIPNLTRGGRSYGLIENVVTDSAFRQRGFGGRVLDAAVASAWDSHCYKVMLLTGSKDPATHRFYANAGFEQSKTGFQIRRIPTRKD